MIQFSGGGGGKGNFQQFIYPREIGEFEEDHRRNNQSCDHHIPSFLPRIRLLRQAAMMSRPPPRRSSRINAIQPQEPSSSPKGSKQKRKIIPLSSDEEFSEDKPPKHKKSKIQNTSKSPSKSSSPLKPDAKRKIKTAKSVKPAVTTTMKVMKDVCVGTEEHDTEKEMKGDALDFIKSAFKDDITCALCCISCYI
jgi:hypothetical protein